MTGRNRYRKLILILIIGLTNLMIATSQVKNQESSSLSHVTKRIIKKIDNQKYLMTNFKIDRKIIRLTNKLAITAADNELINLTDSKNRITACIAFWILVKRENSSTQEIYNKYKNPEKIDSITYKMNEVNKNIGKSDVILIYTDFNFFYDVYVRNEYLNLIEEN